MGQRKVGVILSYIQTAINMFVNLLYVPILLNTIGDSEYGLYQLVGSVIAYLNIMESLLTGSVSRFYSKAHVEGNEKLKENTLAIAQRIYNRLSLILIVFGAVAYHFMRSVYSQSLSANELTEAGFMMAVMVINIIVNMKSYVYSAALTANERFIFARVLQIIMTVMQPVAVILIINRYPYAISVVTAQLLINIGINIVRVIYCRKRLHVRIKYHGKDKELTMQILFLSIQLMFAMIADIIFLKADQLILGMYSTSVVAIYSVGSQIYMNYSPIGNAISGVFMLKITQLYNDNKNVSEISELFIRLGRITMLVLGLVLTGFILYGKEFILLWVGEGYDEAYYVALLIMIPLTVEIIQHIGITILQVVNKYAFRSKVYLLSAIVNVGLTIWLVREMGIIGAALSTGITITICHGFIMNWYYDKEIGLNISKFWHEILKIILPILAITVVGYFISLIRVSIPTLQFAIHVVLYSFVYLASMYIIGMNKYERTLIKDIFQKVGISK